MKFLIDQDVYFTTIRFLKHLGVGVIYLRILPSTLNEGHKEFKKVLVSYSENELKRSFVVIEPGRHRIRRLVS